MSTIDDRSEKRHKDIILAHQHYINLAQMFLGKSQVTLAQEVSHMSMVAVIKNTQIETYTDHAQRQIDQIERRIIQGEKIPHGEKVFSIFEPYTEWICKGKAGVPVELGLKVCIVEDTQGYLLHHRVMQKETDEQVAIDLTTQTQRRYPDLSACSYDKGFHSKENQRSGPQ